MTTYAHLWLGMASNSKVDGLNLWENQTEMMSQFLGTKKPLNAKLGGFVIWEYLKRCTKSAQKVLKLNQ